MGLNIERLEALPTRLSMRESALKIHGGDLASMYDIHGEDGDGTSRQAGHSCRKDWHSYGSHDSDMRRARRQARALMGRD